MKRFKETISLLENSAYYYIIFTNMEGNYSYVNHNYAQAFRHIDANILGKPYFITMHPDDRKVCEETAKKCFLFPGECFPATIRKHDGKGGYIYTQWEYWAAFNEDNGPEGVFCLGYDITEYAKTNKQLKVAQSQIEDKNNKLQQIGWEQSHLIRRPVANILGLVNILQKASTNQNLTNICDMLLESGQQLDEVIMNIVDKTADGDEELKP
jgi:PAS domain S-box-containing protein